MNEEHITKHNSYTIDHTFHNLTSQFQIRNKIY